MYNCKSTFTRVRAFLVDETEPAIAQLEAISSQTKNIVKRKENQKDRRELKKNTKKYETEFKDQDIGMKTKLKSEQSR